jgi:membrane peptidoglycan carboxypeptidase
MSLPRSQETIRDEIFTRLASYEPFKGNFSTQGYTQFADLPDASYEKALIDAIAFEQATHEQLVAQIRDEMQQLAESLKPHTLNYYDQKAREFQLGDVAEVQGDGGVAYSTIDTNAQIISRVALKRPQPGELRVYLAKEGSSGPEPLTSSEETQFADYFDKVKAGGTLISTVSEAADELELNGNLTYDNEIGQQQAEDNATAAIEAYLASIDFGGIYYRNGLINAVRDAEGIVDFTINNANITDYTGSTFNNPDRLEMASGYMILKFSNYISTGV